MWLGNTTRSINKEFSTWVEPHGVVALRITQAKHILSKF
jgi:hypothetical protein